MITDIFAVVSNNQSLTGAPPLLGATAFASNAIDLATSGLTSRLRDIGRGNPVSMRLQVTEAFSGTATSLEFGIVLADSSDLVTTNLTRLPLWRQTTSQLVLNSNFILQLPPIPLHLLGTAKGRRYLGVLYTPAGGTFTTGKVNADFGAWSDNTVPPVRSIGYVGP